MVSRRMIFSPMLRSIAGVMLLLWIASIAVCASDCMGGQKQHDCCHKKSSGTPQDKPLCLHSQTIASAPSSVQISKPDFGVHPFLISQFQNLFRNPNQSRFVCASRFAVILFSRWKCVFVRRSAVLPRLFPPDWVNRAFAL
jgi:hypothetical protein